MCPSNSSNKNTTPSSPSNRDGADLDLKQEAADNKNQTLGEMSGGTNIQSITAKNVTINHPSDIETIESIVQRHAGESSKDIEDGKPPIVSKPPSDAKVFSIGRCTKASFLSSFFILLVRATGVLQAPELIAYDHYLRVRTSVQPEQVDERILLIEINKSDIDEYGIPISDDIVEKTRNQSDQQLTIPDKFLTQALEKLRQARPLAIGVDLHRAVAQGEGREKFIEQFRNFSDIVTVCSFEKGAPYLHPAEFGHQQEKEQLGFSDLETDGGYRSPVRRHLISMDNSISENSEWTGECPTNSSLSLQLARRYFDANGKSLGVNQSNQNFEIGGVEFKRLSSRFGGYQWLDGETNEILLNYRSSPNGKPARGVSLEELLSNPDSLTGVKNKIVIIGYTAPGVDISASPLNYKMPRVWIHAHMVSQMLSAVDNDRALLSGLPQWRFFQWGDWLWVILWSMLMGALIWRVSSTKMLVITAVGLIVILYLLSLLVFLQAVWVPLIPSGLSIMTMLLWHIFSPPRSVLISLSLPEHTQ